MDCRNHCSLDPWICLLKVPSKTMVLKWGKSTKQYYKTHLNLWNPRAFIFIYTWNPNDPCFDWKRPCFGGLKPQNRGQTGSRYIYIYVYIMYTYTYISLYTYEVFSRTAQRFGFHPTTTKTFPMWCFYYTQPRHKTRRIYRINKSKKKTPSERPTKSCLPNGGKC